MNDLSGIKSIIAEIGGIAERLKIMCIQLDEIKELRYLKGEENNERDKI